MLLHTPFPAIHSKAPNSALSPQSCHTWSQALCTTPRQVDRAAGALSHAILCTHSHSCPHSARASPSCCHITTQTPNPHSQPHTVTPASRSQPPAVTQGPPTCRHPPRAHPLAHSHTPTLRRAQRDTKAHVSPAPRAPHPSRQSLTREPRPLSTLGVPP